MKFLILALALSIPSVAFCARDTGGANSAKNSQGQEKLFDDVEDEGTVELKNVGSIVGPLLAEIKKKLPDFAADLESNIGKVDWLLEPKALQQQGECLNESVLLIEKVVRACQSKLAVRIDKKYFDEHPEDQAPLLLHELLVFIKLRDSNITDEAVRFASRKLRDPNASAESLQSALSRAGFGRATTAAEISEYEALTAKTKAARCLMEAASGAYLKAPRVSFSYMLARPLSEKEKRSVRLRETYEKREGEYDKAFNEWLRYSQSIRMSFERKESASNIVNTACTAEEKAQKPAPKDKPKKEISPVVPEENSETAPI